MTLKSSTVITSMLTELYIEKRTLVTCLSLCTEWDTRGQKSCTQNWYKWVENKLIQSGLQLRKASQCDAFMKTDIQKVVLHAKNSHIFSWIVNDSPKKIKKKVAQTAAKECVKGGTLYYGSYHVVEGYRATPYICFIQGGAISINSTGAALPL